MTVVHNVLFKLKDPADVDEAVARLQAMEGRVEVLRSIEVGVDKLGTSRSYHIALTTRFDSWEDLETYRSHPLHTPVLEHMATVIEHSAVVDYEV